MSHLEIRRVRVPGDWQAVRALRYEGLAARAEVPPCDARSFADEFDEAPNTTTYLLAAGARAVGTTRTSVRAAGRRAALPSERVFATEIAAAFGAQAAIVEASLTFIDPCAAAAQDALTRLFKVHVMHCGLEDADALVVAVRETQMGFYRRMFGMEILSGAEPYPGMRMPRVLMGIAFREQAPVLLRRIPALAASADDEAQFARL
ncbi:MAG: N-acyl amino acid synthase FeeM domain-containing protein [Betaproteobacteria bacterium]